MTWHHRPLSLRQVVSYLLKRISQAHSDSGGGRLPGTPATVHTAFYRLQAQFGESIPQLQQLHFVTLGGFPYSHELTDTLDSLQLSGAISRDNPSYATFRPIIAEDTPEWLKSVEVRAGENLATQMNQAVEMLGAQLFVDGPA